MTIKVMRAENWEPTKVKFPVWAEPKTDGCRAYNPEGTLLARTMKQHRNVFTTQYYSKPEYIGFDGELAAERPTHPDLCRLTSSVVSTIEGTPYTQWHIFDFLTPESVKLPYRERYALAASTLAARQSLGLCMRLQMVPYTVCRSLAELEAVHEEYMKQGYEGTCFYGPDVIHKEGKSSPRHNGVLRIKDFVDFEFMITGFTEGEENLNEAQVNELGRQFRSSHQANKISNSMVGNIHGNALADVFDLHDKTKRLIAKGQAVVVSPGNMDHDMRALVWSAQNKYIGQIGKGKFFPKGMKDKPRFPQFTSFRSVEDL